MLDIQWWIGFALLAVLAFFYARSQQKMRATLQQRMQDLEKEKVEQKQLIDMQMQDLTSQMMAQATLQERLQQFEKQLSLTENKLISKEQALSEQQQELASQQAEVRTLETRMEAERKAAAEKLALLEDAKKSLGNEFKVLAQQIFEEKGRVIHEQNRAGLDEVLKPMREQLGAFRQRVDEIHTHETKERATLHEHLNQLKLLNQQMSSDAMNLTHALKGESKVQGNWGEMILQRILESSGLREGHEFIREQSFTGEDGKRLRPDVVIYMPGNKQVIIDSKVSLTDYERAVSSSDSGVQKAALTAHLRSLKSHIQGLSNKRYDHLPEVNCPDYVLMFVPIEGAYLMAIEADSRIFEEAFDQRVAVVTPSTLYATLKLIEQLWRYERQNESVVQLMDRAGKLHDKMADFVKSFEEIGTRLNQAKSSYDTAMGRMVSGSGNVLRQMDQLGKLSGKVKKELPAHLLEVEAVAGIESKESNHEH